MTGPLTVRRLSELTAEDRHRLLDRSLSRIFDEELAAQVRAIVEDVRLHGDAAVVRALTTHDKVDCPPDRLRVSEEEFVAARGRVGDDLVRAMRQGITNIRAFNKRVLDGASWTKEIAPGLLIGEQARPIESVALFVPSGKGSFPSVLMQIGTPAVVAGVPRIIVMVPPSGLGIEVDPAVLVVAQELGLTDVFRVNGPAGVAAAAVGTESIPRARMIVGPGSPAVTAAQIQVQALGCATVMLFGPSESMVIADDVADVAVLAADLLNEAEHGADSATMLVTPSEALVAAVQVELRRQLAALPEPRRGFAASALSVFGGALLVSDLAEACAFANDYAPEHLQVVTDEPEALLPALDHAGEILLGPTPFSVANYVLGVPATLPTGGYAKVSSGVTARTFTKISSIGRTSPEALARLAPAVVALAEHEGFPAHANAVRVRGLPGPTDWAS